MYQFLRKTKINELEVPLSIDEHVLGFHVSICDALMIVKELKDQDHFSNVKAGSVLVEACGSSKIGKDFASRAIVELSLVSMTRIHSDRVCEQACISSPYPKSS